MLPSVSRENPDQNAPKLACNFTFEQMPWQRMATPNPPHPTPTETPITDATLIASVSNKKKTTLLEKLVWAQLWPWKHFIRLIVYTLQLKIVDKAKAIYVSNSFEQLRNGVHLAVYRFWRNIFLFQAAFSFDRLQYALLVQSTSLDNGNTILKQFYLSTRFAEAIAITNTVECMVGGLSRMEEYLFASTCFSTAILFARFPTMPAPFEDCLQAT